jgi:hypothetical protein
MRFRKRNGGPTIGKTSGRSNLFRTLELHLYLNGIYHTIFTFATRFLIFDWKKSGKNRTKW